MKLTVLLLIAPLAFSQGRGNLQIAAPAPAAVQPAQTISISITSELATALENMRLNLRISTVIGGTTVVAPRYTTITEIVVAALSAKQTGLFSVALQRFPPTSIKAAQAAADKARADADAATDKVLPPTK